MNDAEAVVVAGVVADEQLRSIRIELSDGASLEVAIDADEARGITPGLALSPKQAEGLRAADERKRIAREVFRWLERRPRTRADLRRRLVERGYGAEASDAVLAQFVDRGLVDDRAFAEAFGRERLRNRPVGPRWLSGRLRQEGIEAGVIDEVVGGLYAEFEEVELALHALGRKRLDCGAEAGRKRAARFLDSRGFTTGAAVEAIRRARAEADA